MSKTEGIEGRGGGQLISVTWSARRDENTFSKVIPVAYALLINMKDFKLSDIAIKHRVSTILTKPRVDVADLNL